MILPLGIPRIVEGFEHLWDECEGLVEFIAKADDGGLRLKFDVSKGEVDVSRVLGGFFACVWVTEKSGLSFFLG